MKNIAVIGSGTMGNGIAHTFAQFGYQVALIDISQPALDKALATIAKNLDRIVAKGAITEAEKTQTLKLPSAAPLECNNKNIFEIQKRNIDKLN